MKRTFEVARKQTPEMFDSAGDIPGSSLRSLAALRLAAARAVGADLAGIVTYDRRLTVAAQGLGIETSAPS